MKYYQNLIDILKETDKIFYDEEIYKQVKQKGDFDFVTKADIAVSEHIKKRLKETYPDYDFQSEEEPFNMSPDKSYWILDPIDGTTNFMHRLPYCCISLALLQGGKIVCGIIYIPYLNEIYYAEEGKGAYLNGERIYCSKYDKITDCIGFFEYNSGYKKHIETTSKYADKIYLNCQDLRTLGAAAVELALIACGKADVFLGRFLKPWDYAAGAILITEAGGKIGDLNGNLTFTELDRDFVATNGMVYNEFINMLKK